MEHSYVTYYLNPIEVIILDDVLYFSVQDLRQANIEVIINEFTLKFIRCFHNDDIVGYCRKLSDDGELFVSRYDFRSVCYGIEEYVYNNFALLDFKDDIFNYKEYTSTNKAKLEYYNSFMLFNKRCR